MIAKKEGVGIHLEALLQDHGYQVTMDESHGHEHIACIRFDLVIVTNTSLPCNEIQDIIPDIKRRCPNARIIVLSGYCTNEWVAHLRQNGIDGFQELPYEEDTLLKEVTGLLQMPAQRESWN